MTKTGVVPSPTPIRSYEYAVCKGYESDTTDFPEEYTLPEEIISSVYDQGQTSTCVGFSACSCAESHLKKQGDNTRLSEGFFYGRNEIRGDYTGKGLFADAAMKGAVKIGFAPYTLYPILEEVPEAITLANERDDLLEAASHCKPSGYAELCYALEDRTWDNIKRALYKDKCALILISHSYFKGGSHAIMGIGYSHKKNKRNGRYVIFQNSWGDKWGMNGRDKIPIKDIDAAYVLFWDEVKIPFNDVKKDDWFYDDVKSVYLSGLVAGTSETTFEPNGDFIRGDVAVIIARMLDKFQYSVNTFIKTKKQQGQSDVSLIEFAKAPYTKKKFNDVNASGYYSEAIFRALSNGIMEGTSDNEFEPNKTMTRAEAATIVTRITTMLAEKINHALNVKLALPSAAVQTFSDIAPQDWYAPYVNSACSMGLMKGNGDGTFAPERNITRCEGAAIFHRLFKALEKLLEQAI